MGKIVNSTYMSRVTSPHAAFTSRLGHEATRRRPRCSAQPSPSRPPDLRAFPGWPGRAGDDFADRMNAIPKYAVSTTLQDPTWANTTVVNGDVVAGIRSLKEKTAGNIVQYGFGDVSRLLLAHGLLDELKIWLHPVLSGQATPDERLYRDMPQARFDLVATDVHSTGIVVLTYVPSA